MTKFRHLIWMVVAFAGLMLSASQSYAQQPDVGDQPGLLPDDSVELDPEYRKQMVYYRTNEAPGTIIISTAERHLYLVQGNGRALRYRASWPVDPAIHSAPAPCISAPPSTESTAPTVPTRSAPRFHPVASGWSMPTSPISTIACPSEPR